MTMTYTDGRERLEFVDLHGAFGVTLDGQPTGMAVSGIYDAALLEGWLVAVPARGPQVPHVYQGEGRWLSEGQELRGPGVYVGGQKVLPAADPDELDAGLRLEVEYERTKEAAIDVARRLVAVWEQGHEPNAVLVRDLRVAVLDHDKAREAHLAHGGSVWTPGEGNNGG
jgi:hypothetical protein